MTLNADEIKTLEKLAEISDQKWFEIRTPNYIFDSDNKVRLSVEKAVTELIECGKLSSLTRKQRGIVENVLHKITGSNVNTDGFSFNG